MFLFSIGITKGKWGTLIMNLLSFKRHYDAKTGSPMCCLSLLHSIRKIPQDRVARSWRRDARIHQAQPPRGALEPGVRDPAGPGYDPERGVRPHRCERVEHVPVEALAHRTAANGVMPYPPGIPMLMSGENFGDDDGPQIGYMRGLAAWDRQFPGSSMSRRVPRSTAPTMSVRALDGSL